jgi:hypothetical protein
MGGRMTRLKRTVNDAKTRVSKMPSESPDFSGFMFGRCYSLRRDKAIWARSGPMSESSACVRRSVTRPEAAPPSHFPAQNGDLIMFEAPFRYPGVIAQHRGHLQIPRTIPGISLSQEGLPRHCNATLDNSSRLLSLLSFSGPARSRGAGNECDVQCMPGA